MPRIRPTVDVSHVHGSKNLRGCSCCRKRIHSLFHPDCSGHRHRRQPVSKSQSNSDQTRERRSRASWRFLCRQSQISALDDRVRKTGRPRRQRGNHQGREEEKNRMNDTYGRFLCRFLVCPFPNTKISHMISITIGREFCSPAIVS